MALREMIVRHRVGGWAQAVRGAVALHLGVHRRLEAIGGDANDELARWLLERLCPPGGAFVDVGAHIGSVLAGVRRHARPARLVAIEAMPDKAASLRRRFPGVEVHECAAGDAAREASFFVNLAHSGYSSLNGQGDAATRTITVQVRPLDAELPDVAADVVKIDVEGAELQVLRGAPELIARGRPVVMFESATQTADVGAIWDWFAARDYQLWLPNRLAHLGAPLSREGFDEAHVYPRRTTNYFAVAAERRDAVRDRARVLLGVGGRGD